MAFPVGPAPPPSATAPSAPSARYVFKGCVAVATLLLLAGGVVYGYRLVERLGANPVPRATTSEPPAAMPAHASPLVVELIPTAPATPPSAPPSHEPPTHRLARAPKPPPSDEELRPLSSPEQVNRAIDRGVAALRATHGRNETYRNYSGLLGLTLLECGAPADDPSVQQIAAAIRSRGHDLTQTYELTLAILFLDRLGDPRDRLLLRSFGNRLLAGQQECGAWSYSCLLPIPKRPQQAIYPWEAGWAHKHPAHVRRLAYHGDNSNTQFALLGLWVAQRHGVPARPGLLAAEQYFRSTQAPDGSWSYHPNARACRDSMTCAGLMSLAMRHGVINGQGRDIRPDQPLYVSDPAIRHGVQYVAQALDKVRVVGDRIVGAEARDPLYFLWSLERMAVIYDLKKIGDREWYPWAAQMLVATQRPDGRWVGMGDPVGTCFALLILKRSNFARDLQLAVQPPPPRDLAPNGPTIIEGPGATLGPTTTRPAGGDSPAPLGPTTILEPRDASSGR